MSLKQFLVDLGFVGLLVFAWWRGHAPESAFVAEPSDRHGFVLREVAAESGVDFVHVPPRVDPSLAHIEPHVAGVGAAVSIVDFDGDGRQDLYAVRSRGGEPNALYRNLGPGPDGGLRYEDVAPEVGLADLNDETQGCSVGSVWGDVDGDGDQDVLVYKWGRQQLLENRDGVFVDVTDEAGLDRELHCHAATWFDFDRDGLLDLYLGGYFRDGVDLWDLESTRIMQESFEFSRNGGSNYLYRNLGGLRFEDASDRIQGDTKRWTFAVAAADFDADGWTDLYLANDYGPEELWLNREGRALELQEGLGLESASKSGMAVALGDVENSGRLAVYVTNISKDGYLFQGNNLRVNRVPEGGGLVNEAGGAEAECGWAWGAQFGDLDLDGYQDLVVVNGFVSASRDRDYWYSMSKIAGGFGGVFEDAANWPAFEDRSLSGYERSQLLLNRKGRSFDEVGAEVGLNDTYDGRAVALGDLDDDGDLDVVVANQRGPLLLYRNDRRNDHHWIGLELVGAGAAPDAYGAEVVVRFGGQRQRRVVAAATGFSAQNDRRVLVGLGDAAAVDAVDIRWPSGREQRLEGLAVDRYHEVREPTDEEAPR